MPTLRERPGLLALLAVLGSAVVVWAGLYLYASGRVQRNLDTVAEKIRLSHVAVLQQANPQQRDLRVFLELENPTGGVIELSLVPMTISANGESFGQVLWTAPDEVTVAAGETTQVQGFLLIWEDTYERWLAQDGVTFRLSGSIEMTTEVLWVQETEAYDLCLEQTVHFD